MLPEYLHDELDTSQDMMQDVVKDSLRAESFSAWDDKVTVNCYECTSPMEIAAWMNSEKMQKRNVRHLEMCGIFVQNVAHHRKG